MSEECTHDCNSCGQNCGSRSPESLVATPYKGTKIGKIIGVVSGKGGVGKSMVTDLLAVSLAKKDIKSASWMRILPVLPSLPHLVSRKKPQATMK